MTAHIPVLLHEVIELLNPKEGEVFIDGTVGGGGHAEAILKRIGIRGTLVVADWDIQAIEFAKKRFSQAKNVRYIHDNYANLRQYDLPRADGLLLDLGFSSAQIESGGRGFTFLKDEPLIMTYDDRSESVKNFLMRTDVKELTKIISEFGEERYAPQIAKAIIANCRKIETSKQLGEVIRSVVPGSYERGRIHPATRTFQALRIYLNKELENIERMLSSFLELMKPGGRVAIISFHSLEDRLVKSHFQKLAKEQKIHILTKKPITAGQEEIKKNPRSRSAKLRAAYIL
jgi:16S rRNA (cytosine1402-N4)-methyltransferase